MEIGVESKNEVQIFLIILIYFHLSTKMIHTDLDKMGLLTITKMIYNVVWRLLKDTTKEHTVL